MSRTLCNRERLLQSDFEAYCRLVAAPRFLCQGCGRAAAKRKYLCKPKKIRLPDPDA